MKTNFLLLAGFLLLTGACKQDPRRAEAGPAPKTAEEYTQAIVREVQQVILSTDQQLREYQPQRLELPAGEGQKPRVLQLWAEEGNPVKLAATGVGDNGQPQELSTFYFANRELFFATQPGARYIFIGPDLKYWLDDDWKLAPGPESGRLEREQVLPELAAEYLRLFEVKN